MCYQFFSWHVPDNFLNPLSLDVLCMVHKMPIFVSTSVLEVLIVIKIYSSLVCLLHFSITHLFLIIIRLCLGTYKFMFKGLKVQRPPMSGRTMGQVYCTKWHNSL